MNLSVLFQTLKELERVRLWMIELEHPIFGFEQTNIKPNKTLTRFSKILIEQTRTLLFQTSN